MKKLSKKNILLTFILTIICLITIPFLIFEAIKLKPIIEKDLEFRQFNPNCIYMNNDYIFNCSTKTLENRFNEEIKKFEIYDNIIYSEQHKEIGYITDEYICLNKTKECMEEEKLKLYIDKEKTKQLFKCTINEEIKQITKNLILTKSGKLYNYNLLEYHFNEDTNMNCSLIGDNIEKIIETDSFKKVIINGLLYDIYINDKIIFNENNNKIPYFNEYINKYPIIIKDNSAIFIENKKIMQKTVTYNQSGVKEETTEELYDITNTLEKDEEVLKFYLGEKSVYYIKTNKKYIKLDTKHIINEECLIDSNIECKYSKNIKELKYATKHYDEILYISGNTYLDNNLNKYTFK